MPQEMARIRSRAKIYLEKKVELQVEHYVATFLVPSLRHLKGLSEEKKRDVHRIAKQLCNDVKGGHFLVFLCRYATISNRNIYIKKYE